MFTNLINVIVGRKSWPKLSPDLLRKRARLLVIDDRDFPYKELFIRDGYAMEKWDDVDDLARLERNEFDIILLDMHGVGRKESREQGFGILKHLRKTVPAQIVIAYSNADWSLKYQGFFEMADASLDKRADYVEFKRVVDEQLVKRFSLQYYVETVVNIVGTNIPDQTKLRRLAENAIKNGDAGKLERYVTGATTKETVKLVLLVVKTGMHIGAAILHPGT